MSTNAVRHPLDAASLEQLVAAATAAPSTHNTQPWRFRLLPETDTLEVRAVPERSSRAIDPTGSTAAPRLRRTAPARRRPAARGRPLPDASPAGTHCPGRTPQLDRR